jgi:hypothetical protein
MAHQTFPIETAPVSSYTFTILPTHLILIDGGNLIQYRTAILKGSKLKLAPFSKVFIVKILVNEVHIICMMSSEHLTFNKFKISECRKWSIWFVVQAEIER